MNYMMTLLSTLIHLLLIPSLLLFYLLFICLFFWKKRFSKWLLAATLSVSYLCTNGVIAKWIISPLEREVLPVNAAEIHKHKAMVVLGGGLSISPTAGVTADLLSYPRALKAATLYYQAKQMGITYTIFLSGGVTSKALQSEAETFKQMLVKTGIPSAQIILEKESKNTMENAKFTTGLMKEHNLSSALLVTSAIHMKRAQKYFEYFGVEVTPAASDYPWPLVSVIPLAYNMALVDLAMHETGGMLVFFLHKILSEQ